MDKEALNWLLPKVMRSDDDARWPQLDNDISKSFVGNETCREYFLRFYESLLGRLGYEMTDTIEGTLKRKDDHTERFECIMDNPTSTKTISRLLWMLNIFQYEKWQCNLLMTLVSDILSYKDKALSNTYAQFWRDASINTATVINADTILSELLIHEKKEETKEDVPDDAEILADSKIQQ